MTTYAKGRVSLQTLSHSRTATLKDCPAKYGFRYADGLRPKVEDPLRIRGRGLHEGLEVGHLTWRDSRWQELSAAEALEFIRDASVRSGRQAFQGALDELYEARKGGAPVEQCDEVLERLNDGYEADRWALGHFFDVIVPRDYARKIPILVEHKFDVPILDASGRARHLRWIGVFDCVMYDEKTRTIELHEAKTVGTNAGSDEHRRRIEGDPQTTSYIYALRHLQKTGALDEPLRLALGLTPGRNTPIGSVVVNVIRRKKPSEPKILADGTVSTDRRIDTLPEVYEAALEAQDKPSYLMKAEEQAAEARRAFDSVRPLSEDAKVQKRITKTRDALVKKYSTWRATEAKQQNLLVALRQRGDTFIAEIEQFVGDREVERWRSEQWVEAERMRRVERRPAERTRNLGYCTSPGRGCTYRTLCYSGGDEQIRRMEFTTPAERESMAAAEAAEQEQAPQAQTAPSWG